MAETYRFDDWADEDQAWNQETGAPSKWAFAHALQLWSWMQNRSNVSVAEAALAFNCVPARILEAVEYHDWMCLTGPRDDLTKLLIEHEGE